MMKWIMILTAFALMPSASAAKGIKCGNSYISANKVCHIGTTPIATPAPVYTPAPKTVKQTFSNCTEAYAAGSYDILKNDPEYSSSLDRDSDSIACEANGDDDVAPPSISVPVTPTQEEKNTGSLSGCPKFQLSSNYVKITVPASFPNPEATKFVDELLCDGLHLKIEGPSIGIVRKVTIQAKTWQDAWKIILNNYIGNDIQVGTSARIDFQGDVANIYNEFQSMGLDKESVVAFKAGNGKLVPLAFNGQITPQKMINGINRFYMRARSPYGNYQLMEVDTSNGTIILIPEAVMP